VTFFAALHTLEKRLAFVLQTRLQTSLGFPPKTRLYPNPTGAFGDAITHRAPLRPHK